MTLYAYPIGPIDTNSYLYFDDEKNAVLIDAPPDSYITISEVCKEENIKLRAVLLTHSHWDHSADCYEFQSKMKIPIYIHESDEYRIEDPKGNSIWTLPFEIHPCKADKYYKDREILKFGDVELEVLFTPGHTEGGVCLLDRDANTLFSGDTLFNLGVGRTDLPGGNYNKLKNSINNVLYKLPESTKVYPGHGEATTIQYEKKYNNV